MLFTIALVLFVLWVIGLIGGFALGGLIHLSLVMALVVVALQFIAGRRAI